MAALEKSNYFAEQLLIKETIITYSSWFICLTIGSAHQGQIQI